MGYNIHGNLPKKDKPLKVMKYGPNGLGPQLKDYNKRKYDVIDLSKLGLGRSESYRKQMEEKFGHKI